MSKLTLSLLLSVYAFTAIAQEEETERDVASFLEQENPTTADNPISSVTGMLAHNGAPTLQMSFNINASQEGTTQKFINLINFFHETTQTEDEQAIKQLVEKFETLNPKEQQFLHALAFINVATQQLMEEYATQESPSDAK